MSFSSDKSLGDTSDIISDSSGVGTNSDSAACSIGHPSTTVVCMETYNPTVSGHLVIQPGDVIEVVGSTDCGMFEGFVRGTNRTGFFPSTCVQEVQFRQKSIVNVSTPPNIGSQYGSSNTLTVNHQPSSLEFNSSFMSQSMQFNTVTRHRNGNDSRRVDDDERCVTKFNRPRTVILHRAKRGFGFILRGAKQSSPLMQLKPSVKCPALQYLDDVDPGGVADLAGLKPGDFLLEVSYHI